MEDRNNFPVTAYPANPQPNPPQPGTAYTYATASTPPSAYYFQNQNQNYPYAAYAAPPPTRPRSSFLCRIFSIVIALCLILLSVRLIIWLALRPKQPEFRVDSLSISNFTIANDSLVSFTSEIKLTARNPNEKTSIAYDNILTGIHYKGNPLADTAIAPFYQDTKTETSLTAKFAASGRYVQKSVVDDVNGDRNRGEGKVEFNLKMSWTARFDGKGFVSRRNWYFKVSCGDLIVALPTNGTGSGELTGAPKQCRVGV